MGRRVEFACQTFGFSGEQPLPACPGGPANTVARKSNRVTTPTMLLLLDDDIRRRYLVRIRVQNDTAEVASFGLSISAHQRLPTDATGTKLCHLSV